MTPFFKFKKRFLSFMAFVLTPFASVPTSISTIPRTVALPPIAKVNEIPIHAWVSNVDSLLSSNSIVAWAELSNFRLEKAYHYKMLSSRIGEHEYVVCHFSYIDKSLSDIFLRFDRSASNQKDNTSGSTSTFSLPEASAASITPEGPGSAATPPQPVVSEAAHNPSSSRTSFSLKKFLPGSSGSVSRTKSESSLSLGVSSNRALAHDTVCRLEALPSDTMAKSITFSDDLARRPCLWDVMILTSTVHKEKAIYKLLKDQQCYWFADTIFYILEHWAEKHKNGEIKLEKNAKWLGTFFHRRIYERPSGELSIWNKFLDDKREKDLQHVQYDLAKEEEERRKREEWERPLKQQNAVQEQEIAALKQRSVIQDQRIVDQDQRIVDQDQRIVDQDQRLVEQDQRIVEQDQRIVEQNQQIADLQHAQEEERRTSAAQKQHVADLQRAQEDERRTSAAQKQHVADLQRAQEDERRTSAAQKQHVADLQRTQEEMKRQMDAMMEMFTARQGTN